MRVGRLGLKCTSQPTIFSRRKASPWLLFSELSTAPPPRQEIFHSKLMSSPGGLRGARSLPDAPSSPLHAGPLSALMWRRPSTSPFFLCSEYENAQTQESAARVMLPHCEPPCCCRTERLRLLQQMTASRAR